ncbi:hypothetical protein D9756_009968 [Leucocoprinus leucothites]|uniref:Uncharacterized protein n=1 Tax=Leucocoprinus leucothites TaxID=201217 RepID=A0A8H5FSA2_9AGAR|nr:hypothetical protein D9756_009968 [Leucoagaricus leucothites]
MHQEHNIPWNVFATNFKYVHEDKRSQQPRPARFGYTSQGRPTQACELGHLVRKMIAMIREFSKTERAKYRLPSELGPPEDGKLFSDHLRDKYPDYLNSQNQKLELWVDSVHIDFGGNPVYDTAHGDLADVVKVLVNENQMQTLLMLANHPLVPLHRLRQLSWGHHFGVNRIVEAAIPLYIFWNFMATSGGLATGAHRNDLCVSLVKSMTMTMDHEAQQIPHWELYGVKNFNGEKEDLPEVDPVRLQEYLKHLFSLLFRYDMLMAECGVDTDWESEIVSSISWYYGAKTETTQDEEGQWRTQFK